MSNAAAVRLSYMCTWDDMSGRGLFIAFVYDWVT